MPKSVGQDIESQATSGRYLYGSERKPAGLTMEYFAKFHTGHLHNEDGMIAFALAIYGLVIFLGILGYIEMAVVDTFEQIQHANNPALAILAETF